MRLAAIGAVAFLLALSCGIGAARAQQSPFAGPTCPARSGAIFLSGEGVIVGFLTLDQATALRVRTEFQLHAAIHPDYLDNPRAIVEIDTPAGKARNVALVPAGMRVTVGDRVAFDGAYWDPRDTCQYIPNIIRQPAVTG